MTDVDRADLICDLKYDVEKIKVLVGDLVTKYLPMGVNPINFPQRDWNEFIKSLGNEYHRYSIISELIFDNILIIENRVKKLMDVE